MTYTKNPVWSYNSESPNTKFPEAPIIVGDVLVVTTNTTIDFFDIYSGTKLSSHNGGGNIKSITADQSNIYILGALADFHITDDSLGSGFGFGHHTHVHNQFHKDTTVPKTTPSKPHGLIVLDAGTQNVKHEWEVVDKDISQAIHHISVVDEMLICVAEGGEIFGYDIKTVTQKWKTRLANVEAGKIPSPAGYGDGAIFFVYDGKLNAVNVRSGCTRWQYAASDFLPNVAPEVKNGLVIMPGNENVYILTAQNGGKDGTAVSTSGELVVTKTPWIIKNPYTANGETLNRPTVSWAQDCVVLTTNRGNAFIYEIASIKADPQNEPQKVWDLKDQHIPNFSVISGFTQAVINTDIVEALYEGDLKPQNTIFLATTNGDVLIADLEVNNSKKSVDYASRYTISRNTTIISTKMPLSYPPLIANGTVFTLSNTGVIRATAFEDSKVAFFGASGGTINIAHTNSFNFGKNAFSLEAWVRTTKGGTIISQQPQSESACGYYLGIANTSDSDGCSTDGEGRIQFVISSTNDSIGHTVQSLPTKVADGKWHHIAVVRQIIPKIDIYMDGVQQPVDLFMKPSENLSITSTENILIGKFSDYGDETEPDFQGLLADIRFWNVALTTKHIKSMMAKLLTPLDEKHGLVAYYPLNENQLTDYRDLISQVKPSITGVVPLYSDLSLDDSLYPYLLNNVLDEWPYKGHWTAYGEEAIYSPPVRVKEVLCYRTENKLYAIDLVHGTRKWSLDISLNATNPISGYRSFFVVDNGNLLVIEAETGAILWEQGLMVQMTMEDGSKIPMPKPQHINAFKLLQAGKTIIAIVNESIIYAFNIGNGELSWYHEAQGGGSINDDIVYFNNFLYFTSSTSSLECLEISSKSISKYVLTSVATTKSFGTLSNTSILPTKEVIFFWDGANLNALQPKTLTSITGSSWNPPTITNFLGMDASYIKGRLILAAGGNIHFLDYHSGKEMAVQALPNGYTSQKPIIHDTDVFCAASDGKSKGSMYLYDIETGTSSGHFDLKEKTRDGVSTTYAISEPLVTYGTAFFGCKDNGMHSIVFGDNHALYLTGSEQDISLPTLNFSTPSNDFVLDNGLYQMTVEAWVNTQQGGQIIKHTHSRDVPGFSLSISDQGVINASITDSSFTIHSFSSAGGDTSGTTLATDGNWHHIAMVFENIDTTQICYLYLDGVKIRSFIKDVSQKESTAENYIGGSGTNKFIGMIHDIRLWDFAMPIAEMNERMHIKLRGNEAGLVAFWDFGVKELFDSSINGFSPTGSGEYDYWRTPLTFQKPMYPYLTVQSKKDDDKVINAPEGTQIYTTTIAARTGTDQIYPNVNVKVWCSEDIKISITKDGRTTTSEYKSITGEDQGSYLEAITDENGQIELEIETYNLPYNPELQVWAEFMYPNERFRVNVVRQSANCILVPPPKILAQSMMIQDYHYTEGDNQNDGVDVNNPDDGVGIYHISLEAVNGRGMAMRDEILEVWADDLVQIEVNSQKYYVGPGNSQKFKTDGEGHLHIEVDTDNQEFKVPAFNVRAGFTPRDTCFSFKPDEHSRRTLANASGDQLNGASPTINGQARTVFPNHSKDDMKAVSKDDSLSDDDKKAKLKQMARDNAHHKNSESIAKAMRNLVKPTIPSKDTSGDSLGVAQGSTDNKRINGTAFQIHPDVIDRNQMYHRPTHIPVIHSVDPTKCEHKYWSLNVGTTTDADGNEIPNPTYTPYSTEAEVNKEYDESKLKWMYVEDETNPGWYQMYERQGEEWVKTDYVSTQGMGMSFFGKLWHGIEHGAEWLYKHTIGKVVKWVEKISKEIVHEIHHIIDEVVKVVMKTVKAIEKALKDFWNAIKMAIEKAIKFLKSLFDWGEIIRMHQTLRVMMIGGINDFKDFVNVQIPDFVKEEFGDLKKEIAKGFGIDTSKGDGQPLNHDDKHHAKKSVHASRSKWVRHKVKKHANGTKNGPLSAPFSAPQTEHSSDSTFSNVGELFKKIGTDIEDIGHEFLKLLKDLISPKSMKGESIKQIIGHILEDAVDIVEDLLLILVDLIAIGLDNVFTIIEQTLHIPFISWLYKKITHEPLSFMDIFCLVAAIPVHILYAFMGKSYTSEDQKVIQPAFEKSLFYPELATTKGVVTAGGSSASEIKSMILVNEFLLIVAPLTGIAKGFVDWYQGTINAEKTWGGNKHDEMDPLKRIFDGLTAILDLTTIGLQYSLRFWKEADKFSKNFINNAVLVLRLAGAGADVFTLVMNIISKEESYGAVSVKKILRKTGDMWKAGGHTNKAQAFISVPVIKTFLGIPLFVFNLCSTIDPTWPTGNPFEGSSGAGQLGKNSEERKELLKQLQGENGAQIAFGLPLMFSLLNWGPIAAASEVDDVPTSPIVLGLIDFVGYTVGGILNYTIGYGRDVR